MTGTTTTAGTTRGRRAPIALGAALILVVLTGCSGGGGADSSTTRPVSQGESGGSAAGNESAREDGGTDAGLPADQSGGSADRTSARVLPGDRDIVYRGSITVRVKDVSRAAARAEALALQADGVVFSQETMRDPRPGSGRATGEAHLTLRVPPTQFAGTLDALGSLGGELSRSRSAEDVTTQLADTDSRVRSQQRSVDRVRALLDEAATIGEVVQIESELARREADLESLQAQLARLTDVTDLATIEATLIARDTVVVPDKDDDLGFLTGLRNGWDAFLGIALVTLTVLGALLPFVLILAVVGAPAYMLLRGRQRSAASPPTATEA
jgi:hypothetical protein